MHLVDLNQEYWLGRGPVTFLFNSLHHTRYPFPSFLTSLFQPILLLKTFLNFSHIIPISPTPLASRAVRIKVLVDSEMIAQSFSLPIQSDIFINSLLEPSYIGLGISKSLPLIQSLPICYPREAVRWQDVTNMAMWKGYAS